MYRRALAKPKEWGVFRRVIGMALVAFLLTGALTLPEVWAATYYVATTGSDSNSASQAQSSSSPWKTLGKALGVATSGDVISVAAGTYSSGSFPLHLKDGVKIEGAGPGSSTLSAPAGTTIFENIDTALSSGTTLTGFTLKDAGSSPATLVHLQPNSVTMSPTIDGNDFEAPCGCGAGILIDTKPTSQGSRSFTGTISNNTFSGLENGVSMKATLNSPMTGSIDLKPEITKNSFTDADDGVNLYVKTGYTEDAANLLFSPQITGNTGNGNYHDVRLAVNDSSAGVTLSPLVSGNTFTNAQSQSIQFTFERLSASYSSGVATVSPTVTENTIQDGLEDGIAMYFKRASRGSVKSDITIAGNTVTHTDDAGIEVSFFNAATTGFGPQGSQSQIDVKLENNKVSRVANDMSIGVQTVNGLPSPVLNDSTVTITGNSVSSSGSTTSSNHIGILSRWNFNGTPTGSLKQVISGNTVTNGKGLAGILVSASSNALAPLGSADLDLHDNFVDGNAKKGIDLIYPKWPKGSQVLASCNTVTNNGGNGFSIGASASSTSASKHTPDLGGGLPNNSPGLNTFMSNNGGTYDLTTATDGISAKDNWWGTSNPSSHISGSAVTYTPVLSGAPTVTAGNELAASVSSQIITYTDTVTVSGDCGCAGTIFTAPTPTNTTLVPGSVSVTGGTLTGVQSLDPLTVAIGEIDPGDTVTVSWQVQANSGYNGAISEQGALSCGQLGTVKSDDPSTAQSQDPTVVKIASTSVTAIPTLDGIGLAMLFGLLFLAGLLLVRKRKTGVV